MQSSLHDIVDAYQNPFPVSSNISYFRGSRSTRKNDGGATWERWKVEGEEEVPHRQEKLNFAIQRVEEREHQKKVNCWSSGNQWCQIFMAETSFVIV